MNAESTALLDKLIVAAMCVGHYKTLRDSSEETAAYWNEQVTALRKALEEQA